MKCLFTSSVLLSLSHAKTLWEVYGEKPKVPRMDPRSSTILSAAEVLNGRDPENCTFPIDVILIQDTTESFNNDWNELKTVQLPEMVQELQASHPGTRFATMLHKDKPVWPLGVPPTPSNGFYSDFCVRTDGNFHDNVEGIINMYNRESPYGGGDPPECQFVVLLGASQLPFAWSPSATRLFVVVTDAQPHFDLDGFNTMGLPPHSDEYDQEDPDGQCKSQYYPSPDQMKQSVLNSGAYVAVVAYDADHQNGLVMRSWQWVVRHLGQTDGFLAIMMGDESRDFWTKLSLTIAELENVECKLESTTAPPETEEECPPCPTMACIPRPTGLF
eukprot:Gregarina_sp_Poly_1__4795@NODE_2556_length_1988_cov_3636_680375_g1624_i0_p1_GENE_NODE_2556_length_1988_cov_3636_680375_g1624_i0NODE_2556_length_1988_cov_3636_680375_g1624_i0_p1_ORF_typecomplete_len330_score44_39Integrin_beta/PF00362_18/2_9e19VWA/PF00092_28/0_29_NODE_2556_length_1988_cov_3636_680375_g1624_i0201009